MNKIKIQQMTNNKIAKEQNTMNKIKYLQTFSVVHSISIKEGVSGSVLNCTWDHVRKNFC